MYLSSVEMSQLRTDEDSLDCSRGKRGRKKGFSLKTRLTQWAAFEVKWRGLADYSARLDCSDIKCWHGATQKDFFVRSIFQVRFSLIAESCQAAVGVPFLSETSVHTFGKAADRVLLICIPGICWHHRESSKHSTNCPSQCLRTIYLQRQHQCIETSLTFGSRE